ncbi:MAG: FG-GAP repeat domain-containing protein [Elainellaceae cyanobacterium]
MLFNDGSGTFGDRLDLAAQEGPFAIAAEDFNGDGFSDLAVVNSLADTVSIVLANGDGGFLDGTDLAVGDRPDTSAVGDFDGSGSVDLAVGNADENSVSILLGDGLGRFSDRTDFAVRDLPSGLTAADLNGDGILDLASANFFSDDVTVLVGDGAGGFGDRLDIATGLASRAITSGDFNGDGLIDLASVNFESRDSASFERNNVSILLNTPPLELVAGDEFVIAVGTGTDLIRDFEVGRDVLGLADGLQFGDLVFEAGAISSADEILTRFVNFDAAALTEADFTVVYRTQIGQDT